MEKNEKYNSFSCCDEKNVTLFVKKQLSAHTIFETLNE